MFLSIAAKYLGKRASVNAVVRCAKATVTDSVMSPFYVPLAILVHLQGKWQKCMDFSINFHSLQERHTLEIKFSYNVYEAIHFTMQYPLFLSSGGFPKWVNRFPFSGVYR